MKEDIYKYLDYIRKDNNLNILNISNCYANHGVSQYHRTYVEVDTNELPIAEEENNNDRND